MRPRVIPTALFAVALLVASAAPAFAQIPPPPTTPATTSTNAEPAQSTQVSGGYSFLHEAGVGGAAGNTYPWGWVAGFNQRVAGPVWAIAEVTANYRHDDVLDERWSLYGYFGGVRFDFYHGGAVTAFGQALFGAENFRVPGFSETGFAFQPGGGIDIGTGGKLKFRLQGDFRLAHQTQEDTNFKEFRFAASVVYGIR